MADTQRPLSPAATAWPQGGSNPRLGPAWQVSPYQQSQDAVDLLDTQDPQAQALALSQALALLAPGAAAPSGFESRWRQGQGGERWVETRLHRCALAGPTRVLCVSRDGRGWRSRSTSAPRTCAWR